MSCFFFLRLLYNAFNPPARANCIGIAGVNGADQNTIIADTAVQYQGLTIHASNTQTITGNQNMNSAKSIQINISPAFLRIKTNTMDDNYYGYYSLLLQDKTHWAVV